MDTTGIQQNLFVTVNLETELSVEGVAAIVMVKERKTGLHAVLFDLVDTLVETAPIPQIFNKILSKYGVKSNVSDDEPVDLDIEFNPPLSDYGLPYLEFWRTYNVKILRQMGVQDSLEGLADSVTTEWWKNAEVKLYPEVKDTLKVLKELGIRVGIVSNAFQKDVQDVLAYTRLNRCFQVTVGADDVRKPKPHKDIFLYAVGKLKTTPEQTMFVGDLAETDYYGSERAGLLPLLIDRNDTASWEFRKVSNLKEILPYFTGSLHTT